MTWRRLLVDVSYARTQAGNVGITRAVRRLAQELEAVQGPGRRCVPVGFHSSGFRVATEGHTRECTAQTPSLKVPLSARVFQFFMAGSVRKIVSTCLPRRLVKWAWRRHGDRAFDSLSKAETPVRFAPGDLLVLADQSWNYRVGDAARKARREGAQVAAIVYDLIPLRQPQYCNWLFTNAFEEWLVDMAGCADAMVCISKATQDDLLRYFEQRGIEPPPVAHFRLGCDPVPAQVSGKVRDELRRFAADGPCFFSVGSIEPRKNHGLLLDAFEMLWGMGRDLRLIIAGRANPESAATVRRVLHHREYGRRLLWLADASDLEVAWMYASLRALILPSLAEGFGLPLVEARTLGCPVIASDLEVFSEIADAGVWTFARHSPQALAVLVGDHAAADRRAAAGRQASFTWKDSSTQLMSVVENLLGAPERQT